MTSSKSADKDGGVKPLNCDRDAARWAREFNEVLAAKGEQPLDPAWLISWFANAMMCGEDAYRWRKEAEARAAVPECGERNAVLEEAAKVCDQYAADTELRKEERGYWIEEMQAVFNAQKELAREIRSLKGAAPVSARPAFDAEGALAGIADALNIELRENGGWHDQINSYLTEDMRPKIRVLVDKVRARNAVSTSGLTFNDGIEAAADFVANMDNPYREGGETLGMADMIRSLKRSVPSAIGERS